MCRWFRCRYPHAITCDRMADRKGLPEDVRVELRAIREERGLSRSALAEAIGCSMGHVKKIEAGERRISPDLEWAWRSARRKPERRVVCAQCERTFAPRTANGRFCSLDCQCIFHDRRRRGGPRYCEDCGNLLRIVEPTPGLGKGGRGKSKARLCSGCRRERKNSRRRGENRTSSVREAERRKEFRRRGAPKGTPYTLEAVAERDRWRCHLCGKRVKKSAKWPDRTCPSIDHLVPISAGGVDGLENVALAHWYCNTLRGTRGEAQLRLTG